MKTIAQTVLFVSLLLLVSTPGYSRMGMGSWGGWSESSTNDGRIIYVPQDYSSIQHAINAAYSGDTVIVSPGTYHEQITMRTGVDILAEGTDEERNNFTTAERTIIDATGAAGGMGRMGGGMGGMGRRVNTVWGANQAILDGFSITGASGSSWQGPMSAGNGVLCVQRRTRRGMSPTIKNCIISGNSRGIAAGYGAKPTISHNVIRNNEDVGIGTMGHATEPIISNNEIYGNGSGGIGCNGSSPVIDTNYIGDNGGAGIGTKNGAGPSIKNNAIGIDRDGRPHGNALAGIGCDGSAPVITFNLIYSNGEAGVGIRNNASPVITDNEIGSNGKAGIGTEADEPGSTIEVYRNWIHDNQAAGIGCNGVSGLITNNIVVRNGLAGIAVADTPLTGIYNNVVAYNHAVGIVNNTGVSFSIRDNILYANGFEYLGAGPGIKDDTLGYDYNCCYGNNSEWGGGTLPWVIRRNYGGNWVGANGIYPIADPLFVNPTADDFHLQAASPCIDKGDPDVAFNDLDSSQNDMGAYGGQNPFILF